MIGNVFENGTGTWLAFGRRKDPQIRVYIDKGHIFVEGESGGPPNFKKFEGGRVVPDTDRINERAQRRQAKEQRKTDAIQAFKQLQAAIDDNTTDWTNATVLKNAFIRIQTMMRYVGSALNE